MELKRIIMEELEEKEENNICLCPSCPLLGGVHRKIAERKSDKLGL